MLTPVAGGVLLCASEAVANRGAELCVSLVAAMPGEGCEVEWPCPVVEGCLRVAPDRLCDCVRCRCPTCCRCAGRACAFARTARALIAWSIPTIVVRTAPPKIFVPASACPDRAAVKAAVRPSRRLPELSTASTITASPAASPTAAAPHQRLRGRFASNERGEPVLGSWRWLPFTAASAARSAVPLGRLCAPLAIASADAAEAPSLTRRTSSSTARRPRSPIAKSAREEGNQDGPFRARACVRPPRRDPGLPGSGRGGP